MNIETIDADWSQVRLCRKPIFIIGSPRSGTSALGWSLAQHTHLATSAETFFLFHLFGQGHASRAFDRSTILHKNWLDKEAVDQSEYLQALGLGVNALFTSRSQGKRWIDQTPLYTLMVDVLARMFPDALFLHILRDGRRVVNSMIHFGGLYQTNRKDESVQTHSMLPWIHDFRTACQSWCRYVETAMDFAAQHPQRCLTVVNEGLVADPEAGFKQIQEFLEVPYEARPMDYFRANRINSSFQGQWKEATPPKQPPNPWHDWSLDQKRIFVQHAGHTMVNYGLVTDTELQEMERETGVRRDDELVARRTLIHGVQAVIRAMVPAGATVLVVSKGDEELVHLEGRHGWHFPQGPKGEYAGHYPASSREAIAQLEALRSRGAAYLLFPNTAFWWLEHYDALAQYLREQYQTMHHDATCMLFTLAPNPSAPVSSPVSVEHR